MAFPAPTEILLVDLEPHASRVDPYKWLETVLSLEASAGHGGGRHDRVACCSDESEPPLAEQALIDLVEALAPLRERPTDPTSWLEPTASRGVSQLATEPPAPGSSWRELSTDGRLETRRQTHPGCRARR